MQRAHGSPGAGKMVPLVMGFCVLVSFSYHIFQVLMAVLCPTPHNTGNLLASQAPSIPPGSVNLSSHRAEGPQPGHFEAAAAGEGICLHTECLSPSSPGLVHLWEGRGQICSSEPMGPCLSLHSPHLSHRAGGPHLSRSCLGWCAHTSGKLLPHSHP